MTRAIVTFTRSLLSDVRSHRALDEAVSDWQFERTAATSAESRFTLALRMCAACARVAIASVPREFLSIPFGSITWRVALFSAPLSAVFLVDLFNSDFWIRVTLSQRIVMAATLLPSTLGTGLIFGWFYAAAWPIRRRVPSLALAITAFFVTFGLRGWISPAVFSVHRTLVYETSRLVGPNTVIAGTVPASLWLAFQVSAVSAAFVVLAGQVAALRLAPRIISWCLFPFVNIVLLQTSTFTFATSTVLTVAFGLSQVTAARKVSSPL